MKIEKWDDVFGSITPEDRMTAFLESTTDSYAVLQLKRIDETVDFCFMSYGHIQKMKNQPTIDHYEVVYNGSIEQSVGTEEQLEGLYTKFNIDRPDDFCGHSMSVSDIVALKVAGKVSCYYVDSFGFVELPDFLSSKNALRNAEMGVEDDYGMIDGIINNGKQPSVLEQLSETKKATSPKVSAPKKNEMEI